MPVVYLNTILTLILEYLIIEILSQRRGYHHVIALGTLDKFISYLGSPVFQDTNSSITVSQGGYGHGGVYRATNNLMVVLVPNEF